MQSKFLALLGSAALSLGLVSVASAADMAARPYTKAPPMVAAVYDWTGFYVGVNGGWGSSRKSWDFLTPGGAFVASEGSHDATGGTVGGQIGYRWQASQWVFGLEAQGNWADFHGRNQSLAFPAFTNDTRVDAFGLFTGHVGVAFNNALIYVKGGAAVTSDRYRSFATGTGIQVSNNVDDTRWGGVVGVGVEYGFARTGRSRSSTITCSCRTRPTPSPTTVLPARLAPCSAPIASVRTSIWLPPASTTVGVARSSRSTDLPDPISI